MSMIMHTSSTMSFNTRSTSCKPKKCYASIGKSRGQRGPTTVYQHWASQQQPLYHCLQGLTQVEEMLISAVMPIMSLYKLSVGTLGM